MSLPSIVTCKSKQNNLEFSLHGMVVGHALT